MRSTFKSIFWNFLDMKILFTFVVIEKHGIQLHCDGIVVISQSEITSSMGFKTLGMGFR